MATERDLHGPFVNLAVLCRAAERTPDRSISITQVLHRIVVAPRRAAPELSAVVVVSLSSGFAMGTFPVRVELVSPDGNATSVIEETVSFRGQEYGETILQEVVLVLLVPGRYWFDVLLGDRLLTRFPLRVEFLREATT